MNVNVGEYDAVLKDSNVLSVDVLDFGYFEEA